jgi:hypothetical protein
VVGGAQGELQAARRVARAHFEAVSLEQQVLEFILPAMESEGKTLYKSIKA